MTDKPTKQEAKQAAIDIACAAWDESEYAPSWLDAELARIEREYPDE